MECATCKKRAALGRWSFFFGWGTYDKVVYCKNCLTDKRNERRRERIEKHTLDLEVADMDSSSRKPLIPLDLLRTIFASNPRSCPRCHSTKVERFSGEWEQLTETVSYSAVRCVSCGLESDYS